MASSILINIGFSLSEPLHKTILDISQQIRDDYNSDWYLHDEKYHLHFPMYLIPIPEKDKSKIPNIADQYLKHCQKLNVTVKDIFCNSNGLIMVKFALTKELLELHTLSLKYFNPLRDNLQRDKYLNKGYISGLSQKEQSYIKKYGSEYVLDNYVPHVTIARIESIVEREEILNKYRNVLINSEGTLNRLQVHTAVFSKNKDEDKTVLLYDTAIEE